MKALLLFLSSLWPNSSVFVMDIRPFPVRGWLELWWFLNILTIFFSSEGDSSGLLSDFCKAETHLKNFLCTVISTDDRGICSCLEMAPWTLATPVSAIRQILFMLAKRNYHLNSIMISDEILIHLGLIKL